MSYSGIVPVVSTDPKEQGINDRAVQTWGVLADTDSQQIQMLSTAGGAAGFQGGYWDGRYIWGCGSASVVKLSTAGNSSIPTLEVTAASLGVGSITPKDIVYDGKDIWFSSYVENLVYRIDRISGAMLSTNSITSPNRMEFDGENVWVSDGSGGITQIAPNTLVATALSIPGALCEYMVFDGTYLWVSSYVNLKVYKIQPFGAASVVTSYTLPSRPRGITFDGTYIWTVSDTGNAVHRIHTVTGAITSVSVAAYLSGPTVLVWDGRVIQVGDDAGSVIRINPTSMRVLRAAVSMSGFAGMNGFARAVGDGAFITGSPDVFHGLFLYKPHQSHWLDNIVTSLGTTKQGSAVVDVGPTASGTVGISGESTSPYRYADSAFYLILNGTLAGNTRVEPSGQGPWAVQHNITDGGNILRFGSAAHSSILTAGSVHIIGFNPMFGTYDILFQNP